MDELAVMMDLARQVGVVLLGRLEYNLGSIGELVGCQVDLAEGAFADQAAKRVVADRLEVLVGEFVQQRLVRVSKLEASARPILSRGQISLYLGLSSMRLRLPPCRLHPSAPTS